MDFRDPAVLTDLGFCRLGAFAISVNIVLISKESVATVVGTFPESVAVALELDTGPESSIVLGELILLLFSLNLSASKLKFGPFSFFFCEAPWEDFMEEVFLSTDLIVLTLLFDLVFEALAATFRGGLVNFLLVLFDKDFC